MEQSDRKRWIELSQRAFARCCYTYSEFLSLAEQEELSRLPLGPGSAPLRFWGGFEEAERKLACFGSPELCGYEELPPLSYLEIAPVAERFADSLSHRDFLGALLSLGLRRSVLGDILIQQNRGYLICLEHIAGFIQEQLCQVRHTTVCCRPVEQLPEAAVTLPEPVPILLASERLDALVAAVYHLSRSASQQLICQGRVALNDREAQSANAVLRPGDRVSVRGKGRFIYEGIDASTRKGRLRVMVRIF
ncbi:MAG: hypothetical protein IJP07_06405 [Firmicutes bacterium]|nr:hypothetical protein [Bacillota bacterium]